MNVLTKTLRLAAALLLGISSGCSRKAPQAGPPTPEVLVTEAVTRDVPVYLDWVGTIEGSETADIRARVSGHLMKRDYIEGSNALTNSHPQTKTSKQS